MTEDPWQIFLALWSAPWWQYQPVQAGFWDHAYHAFNLLEGGVWLAFCLLVLHRWWTCHGQSWELWYSLCFLLFGLTDFREAWVQTWQLVLLKSLVLGVLWWLRGKAIRQYSGRTWW